MSLIFAQMGGSPMLAFFREAGLMGQYCSNLKYYHDCASALVRRSSLSLSLSLSRELASQKKKKKRVQLAIYHELSVLTRYIRQLHRAKSVTPIALGQAYKATYKRKES